MDPTSNPINPLNTPAMVPNPVPAPAAVAPTSVSGSGANKWTIITILLLLFVYPIGLILMWLKTSWPKWLKIVLTLLFVLGIAGFVAMGALVSKTLTTQDSSSPQTPTAQVGAENPVSDTTVAATTSVPADWKTYSDSNFTFKYPGDNFAKKDSDGNVLILPNADAADADNLFAISPDQPSDNFQAIFAPYQQALEVSAPKDLKTEKLSFGTKYTATVSSTSSKLYVELVVGKPRSGYASLLVLSDNPTDLATNAKLMEQTAATIK